MSGLNESKILGAIASLRSAAAQVFGADAHGFQLNPTLLEAEVSDFERRYGVALPADYRKFLTSVGNGGAGPYYGLFPLGYADDGFELRAWQENDALVGILAEPFPLHEEWNDLSGRPPDKLIETDRVEYDRQAEAFENRYWAAKLVNGAIPICHEGCALRIYLVVSGAEAGQLWEDRRTEFAGITPVRLKDGSVAAFGRWYEEWLEGCLAEGGERG